ncbi:sulfate transporter family-domain-containing protein [Sporodiniella umbellata]|nr:sulfate transporter family-domain-containing protein [Sporodiniella umbellata]
MIKKYETLNQSWAHEGYAKSYLSNKLPIIYWLHHYNLTWLISDFISGVTVGIIAVPQGMGYAKIANLPPQYGLYSSFVGLCIYCFLGTSKDISIGPTAVMSLLVGQTVANITSTGLYNGPQVAVTLSLFGGFIALFIGLTRLGILVDFIPSPAIHGFMTGSSLTISIGQLPKLFGIKSVHTSDSAYLNFGHFFEYLSETKLDAAFGLLGLIWLYSVKLGSAYLTKKYPKYENAFFFFNIMRNGILVVLGTLVAYLINIGRPQSLVSILGKVPSGLTAMEVPKIHTRLISEVSTTLPSVVIILILEHIAIAKSFGRISNYKIDPDQEILAIGAANIAGSFFGAYPNTGSFSRTAITARSGARTPMAGVFSALVVLLCLYFLTPAFYYIPDAVLAAVIVHAVIDLASGPKYVRHLFSISPFESFTFISAVLVTFFTNVEYGIYASVALSLVGLLLKIARPRCSVLGRIFFQSKKAKSRENAPESSYVYIRHDHQALSHLVLPLPYGILAFRMEESLTYLNSGYITAKMEQHIKNNFASGIPPPSKKGDRLWNDRGKTKDECNLQKLYALILDCSGMSYLDSTGAQSLQDLRAAVQHYTNSTIEWHFANIPNSNIRHTLLMSGFGTPFLPEKTTAEESSSDNVEKSGDISELHTPFQHNLKAHHTLKNSHLECSMPSNRSKYSYSSDLSYNIPLDRSPFFHWDINSAVNVCEIHIEEVMAAN